MVRPAMAAAAAAAAAESGRRPIAFCSRRRRYCDGVRDCYGDIPDGESISVDITAIDVGQKQSVRKRNETTDMNWDECWRAPPVVSAP